MGDFTTGSHECFCDKKYKDANKLETCGDCPRDYIAGAWDARRKYIEEHFRDVLTAALAQPKGEAVNTEEIIKLAREAGGNDEFTSPPTDWNKGLFIISPEQLSKFATLVRNAALKEVTKVIEEYHIPVRAERLEKEQRNERDDD